MTALYEVKKVLWIQDHQSTIRQIPARITKKNEIRFQLLMVNGLKQAKEANFALFDLILLDLFEPDKSILETVQQIREIKSDIPLVVLASDYDEEEALEVLQLGAQDYLDQKRIKATSLSRVLHYAIKRQTLLQTNRRLLAEIQALSTRISAVNEIATAINQSLKLDEILQVVGKQAKWLLDFDHCSVCLQDEGEWRLESFFGASTPFDMDLIKKREPLARVLKSGYPQLIRRQTDASFLSDYASQILIPLKFDGQVRGTINFATFAPKAYNQEDLRIGYLLALQVEAAMRNAYSFAELNRLYAELGEAQRESEALLLNVLPKNIAQELKGCGEVKPVYHDCVSVMFTDFKGFTKIAEKMTPSDLVAELDYCFSGFDQIIETYQLEKLKTIGDAYMCAGGIPLTNEQHAQNAVSAALDIQTFMKERKWEKEQAGKPYWQVRIGIHSGPVVAGVIGQKKFAYDIWGDAVNLASRMESSGVPGQVNISKSTYELVKDTFECQYRGRIPAKNKGDVEMYLVCERK